MDVTSNERLYHVEARRFAAYLFYVKGLQHSTITNYVQGVSTSFNLAGLTEFRIWNAPLKQVLSGIKRNNARETPLSMRHKLPFTRALVIIAHEVVLLKGCTFVLQGIHAALCLGLMFLLRKSEFLTDASGRGKMVDGLDVTLLASNVFFWFGDVAIPATATKFPAGQPDMMSIYLLRHKGDPYGKGATRFFMADRGCNTCMVSLLFAYVKAAHLRPHDHLFTSVHGMVTPIMVSNTIKRTATVAGLQQDRCTTHSLRVGGLVSLLAADVPIQHCVMAGRWASDRSLLAYARATMAQYKMIGAALNDPSLVTAVHIKRLYA